MRGLAISNSSHIREAQNALARCAPRGPEYEYASQSNVYILHLIPSNRPADLRAPYHPIDVITVDFHQYNTPQWFANNSLMFDSYPRNSTLYFVGEYAVTSTNASDIYGQPANGRLTFPTMQGSASEAAFMTGMERNSDVVFASALFEVAATADNYVGARTHGRGLNQPHCVAATICRAPKTRQKRELIVEIPLYGNFLRFFHDFISFLLTFKLLPQCSARKIEKGVNTASE